MTETTIKFKIPKLTDGEIEAVSRNQAISKVVRILVDRIALIVLSVGALATAASSFRALAQGWHLNIVFDIAAYAVIVLTLAFRRRMPAMWVAGILLVLAGVLSLSNFYTIGLGSMGLAALIALCVITGAFFGFRVGMLYLVMTVVGMSVAAGLLHFGIISPSLDMDTYLTQPGTWLSQVSGYVLYGLTSLVVVTFIQKRLWSSLEEVNQTSYALKEREEMYRVLTENMRDALLLWDTSGRFTYVSPSARDLFGYTVEEMLDLRIDDLLTPVSLAKWKQQNAAYFSLTQSKEEAVPLLEYEFLRKDGTRFFGELMSAVIRNDQGTIVGVQGNLRDVSDRRQAEEERQLLETQLYHSEKMQAIGQLAGGVAHDFNNQLAGILGLAELMHSKCVNDKRLVAYVDGIISGVNRASDLTQKLLAFARKGKYQSAIIDVHSIIREVIAIVSRSMDKSIRVVAGLEAAPSTIRGDPSQIQNALLNIAINARDAMPNGGKLTFSTRLETLPGGLSSSEGKNGTKPYVSIVITDTGVGMTRDVKQRIFEPFFTTKAPQKGTGMGLAAVYGTVKHHDGVIDVSSSPGEGARFRIFFPVCEELLAEPELVERQSPVPGTGNILLIDDEEAVLSMTTEVLTKLGYSVRSCATGTEALELYRRHWKTTDLVVLDLILPEVSGQQVFQEIRAINAKAKVMLCSGYSLDGTVQALLNDDITEFVQKPFTMGTFSRTIAGLLTPDK